MTRRRSNQPIFSEMIEVLIRVGVSQNASLVLFQLITEGSCDASTLKKNCGISQPEVSLGITELRNIGVVNVESIYTDERGRPKHIYSLNGSIEEALGPIIERTQDRLDELDRSMIRIEEISDTIRSKSR